MLFESNRFEDLITLNERGERGEYATINLWGLGSRGSFYEWHIHLQLLQVSQHQMSKNCQGRLS